MLPEGTIPRGEAFFDPVLRGKTGTARLAAATGAPVVPVGLWGTEQVWPRSARGCPTWAAVLHPPTVRVRVGRPVRLELDDAAADTELLMAAIADAPAGRGPPGPPADPRRAGRTYPPGARRPSEGDAPHR